MGTDETEIENRTETWASRRRGARARCRIRSFSPGLYGPSRPFQTPELNPCRISPPHFLAAPGPSQPIGARHVPAVEFQNAPKMRPRRSPIATSGRTSHSSATPAKPCLTPRLGDKTATHGADRVLHTADGTYRSIFQPSEKEQTSVLCETAGNNCAIDDRDSGW